MTSTASRPQSDDKWNPETHPYRVSWVFQTSAPGCYGWGTREEVFPTKDDALAAMNRPFASGVKSATVHVVEGTPPHHWKWKYVGGRKRRKNP